MSEEMSSWSSYEAFVLGILTCELTFVYIRLEAMSLDVDYSVPNENPLWWAAQHRNYYGLLGLAVNFVNREVEYYPQSFEKMICKVELGQHVYSSMGLRRAGGRSLPERQLV
jgi:hypothetical protein